MGGASLFSRPKAKCVPHSLTHSFSWCLPFLPLFNPFILMVPFLIFHSGLGISSLVCCLLIMAHDLVGFGFGEGYPA